MIKFYLNLVVGTGVLISACAAIMSVAGLTTIFKGAPLVVMLMGSILEFAKVLISIYTHLYWRKIKRILIGYLTFALIVLMSITSLGIYGYLSKAYVTSTSTDLVSSKVDSLKLKLDIEMNKNKMILEQISSISSTPAEEKTSWHYNRIRQLSKDMDALAPKIDEINKEYIEEKSKVSVIEAEVGPLKYLAEFIYGTQERDAIDKSVQIFIIMIVLVFDPLAILLILAGISAQSTEKHIKHISEIREEKEEQKKEEIIETPKKQEVTKIETKEKPPAVDTKEESLLNTTRATSNLEKRKKEQKMAEAAQQLVAEKLNTPRKDIRILNDEEDINKMYNEKKMRGEEWLEV